MSLLTVVAERIAQHVPTLKSTEVSINFEAVQRGDKPAPAAFVVPLSDRAEKNSSASGVIQRVDSHFGVVVAYRYAGDVCGSKSLPAADDLYAMVRAALLGYSPVPAGEYGQIEFVIGQPMRIEADTLWWMMEFKTEFFINA